MLKKSTQTILIAIATSAALIAFAFDQRHEARVITMNAVELYALAAIICVSQAFYALLRRKSCPSKPPNIS